MAALGIESALDVLSLITGGLDLVNFASSLFKEPDTKSSVMTVAVGMNYKGGLQDAGGSLPDVRNWNEAGDFLGMVADPGSISNGEQTDFKVPHYVTNSGQQAAYSLINGNDDAICIAYVTITWPDGNKYAWDGSWGKQCGGSWYYSHYAIKGSDQEPPCLWLDKNGDYPQTAFQIHWKDFVQDLPKEAADKKKMVDGICGPNNSGSTSFVLHTDHDPNSISYTPLKPLKSRLTRFISPRNSAAATGKNNSTILNQPSKNSTYVNPHLNKLIISNSTAHSVSQICESKTSVGPDFVNVGEGEFCRMSDKTLWPICTNLVKDKCFNFETKQLVVGGKATRSTPYIDIGDWTV